MAAGGPAARGENGKGWSPLALDGQVVPFLPARDRRPVDFFEADRPADCPRASPNDMGESIGRCTRGRVDWKATVEMLR